MQITFKVTKNTAHSDHLNFRFRSDIKRIMRFQKYIAILSDDLYLYSRRETFNIQNVIYIDDSFFYTREGKKIYRLTHYYGRREEVCTKDECCSSEMVGAMRSVSADDLVYRNSTKMSSSIGNSTELVGIYDKHLIVKKGTRVFYKMMVFDGTLAHLYKKYLVLAGNGFVSLYDMETHDDNRISYQVKRGIRTRSLNRDTFLTIDDMLVYGSVVVSRRYARVAFRDLMHELIANARDKETAYRFLYHSNFDLEELNAEFDRHFEQCKGMLADDFRKLLVQVFNSDLECFDNGFVQYVEEQGINLKRITEKVILERGVKHVLDEIFLVMVFFKVTNDDFFFNLIRLRFLYDSGANDSNHGSVQAEHLHATDSVLAGASIHRNANTAVRIMDIRYERLFFYDKSVNINKMVKKHRIQKDVECIKKILYESKIRFDADDFEGKRRDAQNIRKHAALGDALVYFLSKKMGKKRLGDKLMNRNITKLNDVRTLLSKKTYPLLSVLFADHVTKIREKSQRRGPYSNERRKFYDFYYRLVHTIKYSETICTYTPMNDSFLELVLNGFLFMNTDKQWVKRKLFRKEECKPEEIFMSEVLRNCIDFEEIDVNGLFTVKDNQSNSYYYRVAGRLFYICLWFVNYCDKVNKKTFERTSSALTEEEEREMVKDKKRKEITQSLLGFCLEMEERMHMKKSFRVVFDYALIVLCVINSGTCDLDVLRIVRRKILETKDAKFLTNRTSFYVCCDEGCYVTGCLDYGRILKYKMCLGVLCSGLGHYKLKERMSTVKYLIIAFYPVWPVAIDDHKDYTECRYVIFNALEKKPMMFTYRVLYGDEYDKKYRLDILSDYCEKNDECTEKWEHLVELMLEMR